MPMLILSALQMILVIVLVVLVLLQPPRNSRLGGFSNSQQGLNSIFTVKSSTNPLSKTTATVAGLFIINTLLLSGLCSKDVHKKSIAEKILLEKKQENEFTSVPFES